MTGLVRHVARFDRFEIGASRSGVHWLIPAPLPPLTGVVRTWHRSPLRRRRLRTSRRIGARTPVLRARVISRPLV